MLMKAGFLLLAVAVLQVSAEYVEPEFIENVQEREADDPSLRIVSGWEALPGEHPHQAAIRMVDPTGSVSACGGSFVHREWMITAAHCTAGRVTIVVRGGVVGLTHPEYIYESTTWWNYPTYNDNDVLTVQPNDISILKLARPVTYTNNLKAIRIQPLADAYRNYNGERVHTSGHGRTWTSGSTTEVLRWVYMLALDNPTCQLTFGTALITENAICARYYNETSQSTCQEYFNQSISLSQSTAGHRPLSIYVTTHGPPPAASSWNQLPFSGILNQRKLDGDSGGPLVHVDTDGVETLIGVTSFVAGGNWGCHSGLPAGFIRPGPFHAWFTEVSGIDFDNLQEEEDEVTEPAPEDEDSEGSGEDNESSGEDSSDSDEDSDEEMSQLLKRLQVNVKVKVVLNKYKFKKEVEKDKEISHNI